MTIVYAIVWLLIAIYLFYYGIKNYRILLIFSVYFLYNACWTFADYFVEADMLRGSLGWVFRGVTAVFLIIACVYYYFYRKNGGREQDINNESKK